MLSLGLLSDPPSEQRSLAIRESGVRSHVLSMTPETATSGKAVPPDED